MANKRRPGDGTRQKRRNAIIITVAVLVLIGIVVALSLQPLGNFFSLILGKEPITSADGVDFIPDINLNDCLERIAVVNPDMSDQQIHDNCYTIEAINTQDPNMCGQVSEGFRSKCIAQFQN